MRPMTPGAVGFLVCAAWDILWPIQAGEWSPSTRLFVAVETVLCSLLVAWVVKGYKLIGLAHRKITSEQEMR